MTLAKEVVDDVAAVVAVGVVGVEHLGRRLHQTQRQSPMLRKFPKRHFNFLILTSIFLST